MQACWTVVAKRGINSNIPQGFTVTNVVTPTESHDYPSLARRLKDMGIPEPGGTQNDDWWEWRRQ